MALKASIRRAVKQAFLALDDIPRKATYKSVSGAPVRDLESGTFSMATSSYVLPMVAFTRFSAKEVDKDPALLLTDSKLLYPSEDLPIQPKEADTVVDDQGLVWEIIRRLTDPAAVVTILQVRTS